MLRSYFDERSFVEYRTLLAMSFIRQIAGMSDVDGLAARRRLPRYRVLPPNRLVISAKSSLRSCSRGTTARRLCCTPDDALLPLLYTLLSMGMLSGRCGLRR